MVRDHIGKANGERGSDEWRFYKRSDHFAEGEPKGHEVRILQVGTQFVWVDQALVLTVSAS